MGLPSRRVSVDYGDHYRELMKKLYEPGAYYRRIRVFLKNYQPSGPRLGRSGGEFKAAVKSFWLLGVWHRGRIAYWRLFLGTLIRRPRKLPRAIELAITGYHFRRMSDLL